MSDISKASQDAIDAARQSEQFAVMLAAITAAQQATQQAQPPACTHNHAPAPQAGGGAMKWLAIGVGGSALLLAVAVSAIAVAISAVALTVCLLVLRSVWQDMRKSD